MILLADNTREKKGFLQFLTNVGEYIYRFFAMQFWFVVFTLRGGIVLGIFPAVTAIFSILFKLFNDKDKLDNLSQLFKFTWKAKFKLSNQVGYFLILIFGFLFADLRINERFIQSSILHTLLLFVIAIIAFITIYMPTIVTGYDLGFKKSISQSFFVSLSTPKFTIAAMLGLIIMFELLKQFTFLVIFFGAPLIILPVAWFTYTGLKDVDEKKKELTT